MKKRFLGTVKIIVGMGVLLWVVLSVLDIGSFPGMSKTREYHPPAEPVMEEIKEPETESVPEPEMKAAEEPQEQEPDEPQPGGKEKVTLFFGGDLLLGDGVIRAYDSAGIDGIASEEIRREMEAADLTIVNQEFPFGRLGQAAEDKEYTFQTDPGYAGILNELFIDLVSLANNHTLDYGTESLLETFDTLDQAGITYAGAGRNLEEAKQLKQFQIGEYSFGFLAASRVIPETFWNAGANHPGMLTTYDPGILLEQIEHAAGICDFVIVYVHWGIERNTEPEEYQRELARKYIDAGADAVFGSHPHVLQGFEYYDGKPIAYSLGNFIFGSRETQTWACRLEISSRDEIGLYVLPCEVQRGRLNLMENPQSLYQRLTELSYGARVDEDGWVRDIDAE